MFNPKPTLKTVVVNRINLESYEVQKLLINGIINISAYCRSIMPEIEAKYGKKVTQGSLVMAVKRLINQ